MDIMVLARGLLLGFAVAAPVGPVGVLVIRRTLLGGRTLGFISGVGAATADALYGAAAAFGLTYVTGLLTAQAGALRLIGGAVLCYLGIAALRDRASVSAERAGGRGGVRAYASVVLLTLTNPATVVSFAAGFAALGAVGTGGDYAGASFLTIGVFLGSSAWWFCLTGVVALARPALDRGGTAWFNRLSGLLLTVLGIAAMASATGAARRLWPAS